MKLTYLLTFLMITGYSFAQETNEQESNFRHSTTISYGNKDWSYVDNKLMVPFSSGENHISLAEFRYMSHFQEINNSSQEAEVYLIHRRRINQDHMIGFNAAYTYYHSWNDFLHKSYSVGLEYAQKKLKADLRYHFKGSDSHVPSGVVRMNHTDYYNHALLEESSVSGFEANLTYMATPFIDLSIGGYLYDEGETKSTYTVGSTTYSLSETIQVPHLDSGFMLAAKYNIPFSDDKMFSVGAQFKSDSHHESLYMIHLDITGGVSHLASYISRVWNAPVYKGDPDNMLVFNLCGTTLGIVCPQLHSRSSF